MTDRARLGKFGNDAFENPKHAFGNRDIDLLPFALPNRPGNECSQYADRRIEASK
ncbi:hypothetical protein D3C86_1991820 [compost metagenome]